ncbi:outer membrane beta-barrel protein [Telluribacter sp.]|jgi:hypothetical protein|uniref:outer membrane beta-barrel protein n=1 Tax=Telluribacter sp. TaxID=1978767 RepID=UPI002E104A99|nr:outer membrane beta-barrel protein [Telluribacter sp.]
MNQSEKHNFEEEWRRAFDEASEAPPPSVWDALEAQLDQPEKATAPIVPLWWRSPRLWYAAAAVGALLLVSWPLLLRLDKNSQSQLPTVAVDKNNSQAEDRLAGSAETGAEAATGAESATGQKKEAAPAEITAPATEPRYAASNRTASGRKASREQRALTPETLLGPQVAAVPGTSVPGTSIPGTSVPGTSEVSTTSGQESTVPSTADSRLAATETPRSLEAGTPMVAMQVEALSPRGFRELAVYPQKRYVYFRYDAPDDMPLTPPARSKEYWAGVGVMPAAFNPAVNVTSPPAAFSAANAGRQSMSSSSRAGLSYAVQTQGGVKLSKHWSLETGVSYLQANSTFVSDGYVLDAMSNRSANVLENALMAGSSNRAANDKSQFAPSSAQDYQMSAVYIDLDQHTRNDYRYLQLPVQAGYTLNPEGKVSYTVLGGMVANVFLRNDLETAPGYTVTNTAGDGVYRGLNWSAATGVRLSYHLSSHWTASLTGSYQKALATGIQNNDNISSHPQLYGLGWGFRYLF